MPHLNFEFKAKSNPGTDCESLLQQYDPLFAGEDRQTDTYFNVSKGRLKLREGNIENALIYYERENIGAAKESRVIIHKCLPGDPIKSILQQALGIKVVVDKTRRIYFIENVKFHFDDVKGLGKFLEVEAIDSDGTVGIDKLKQQCEFYSGLFELKENNFISESYSDLLLNAG